MDVKTIPAWFKPRAARLLASLVECTLEARGHEGLLFALHSPLYRQGALALLGLREDWDFFALLQQGCKNDWARLGLWADLDAKKIGVLGGSAFFWGAKAETSTEVISLAAHKRKKEQMKVENQRVSAEKVSAYVSAAFILPQQISINEFWPSAKISAGQSSLIDNRVLTALCAFADVALFSKKEDASSQRAAIASVPYLVGQWDSPAHTPYLLDVTLQMMLRIEQMLHARKKLARQKNDNRAGALYALVAQRNVLIDLEPRNVENILRREKRFLSLYGAWPSLKKKPLNQKMPVRMRRFTTRDASSFSPEHLAEPLKFNLQTQGELFVW